MSLSWLSCASSPCVSFVNSENSSKMSISCYNSVGERGCRQTESNLTWGRRQYCISSRCLSGHLKAEKVTGVLENLSWWNCSLAIVLVLVFITVSGMSSNWKWSQLRSTAILHQSEPSQRSPDSPLPAWSPFLKAEKVTGVLQNLSWWNCWVFANWDLNIARIANAVQCHN